MKNEKMTKILFKLSFVILLVFIKPGIIYNYPEINDIFNLFMLILTLIFFIFFIKQKKKSKIIIYMTIYFLYFLFCTIYNKVDTSFYFKNFIPIFGIAIYTDYLMQKNKEETIKYYSQFFYISIIINFISILLLPHDLKTHDERIFFLGYDNVIAPLIITGCSIIFLNSYIKKGKLSFSDYFITIITILSCFLMYSSSATLAGVLFILLAIILFINNKILVKLINYNAFFIISIIMFISIIILKLQDSFSYIIQDLLNRDLTFTGRTFIWENAISLFNQSPIIGIGVLDTEISMKLYGVFHAHNTILQYLYMGGVIGLSIFVYIILYTKKNIKKINNDFIKRILTIPMIVFFVLSMTEYYLRPHFLFILIVIIYHFSSKKKEDLL